MSIARRRAPHRPYKRLNAFSINILDDDSL